MMDVILGIAFGVAIMSFGIYWYNKNMKVTDPKCKTIKDFKVGSDYTFGRGIPGIDKLAANVFLESAKKGDPDAFAALGNMYGRGIYFEKDYKKSFDLYKLAVNAGHPTAMYELACLYCDGNGVEVNEEEARRLLLKSAYLGEPSAQSILGVLYQSGFIGFNKDLAESFNWSLKAAEQGYMQAQFRVAEAYCTGQGVPLDEIIACEWYKKAAEQGDVTSIDRLGLIFDTGINGIEKHPDLSYKWYSKGAELGSASCEFGAGCAYLIGKGVDKDYDKAVKLIFSAAEKGHAAAECYLGIMFAQGIYFAVDREKAKKWLLKAEANGDSTASEELNKINL